MAFLDAQTRAVLFDPPDIYEDALARYALSAEVGHRPCRVCTLRPA